jgi:hypothetical protein
MKRPLINILILMMLLAGLLITGEHICQAVQNPNDEIDTYFVADPNDPGNEAVLNDCQIICLSEDSDDEADEEDEDEDKNEDNKDVE